MAQKKSAVVKALEQVTKQREKVQQAGGNVRAAFEAVDQETVTSGTAKTVKKELAAVLKLRKIIDKAGLAALELNGALEDYLREL